MSQLANEILERPEDLLPEQTGDRVAIAPVAERVNRRGHRKKLQFSSIGWWVADCSIAFASLALAYVASPAIGVAFPFSGDLLLFGLLLGLVANITGLHDQTFSHRFSDLLTKTIVCVLASIVMFTIGQLFFRFDLVGRYILVFTSIFCIVGMTGFRLLIWHLSKNFALTICFLGEDDFRFRAANLHDEYPQPFKIKEFENVSDEALSDWAIKNDVDEIIYDTASKFVEDAELLRCIDQGINIRSFPDFVETNYRQVPVDQIDAAWLFQARIELAHPYARGLKRMMDITVALVGLVVTAPLVLIAMALIKLESPGSAFYSQIRAGRFNRPFRIYKLRSMVLEAENNGAQWAEQKDSRVLKIGRILRLTRIDEFPQFWNILRGEMSLVGPRPERPEFVEMLSEEIPFYLQRHLVHPGLTGWAQINCPYGASITDARNKLKFDLYYVKKNSIALDVQISLRTIGAIMKGAR